MKQLEEIIYNIPEWLSGDTLDNVKEDIQNLIQSQLSQQRQEVIEEIGLAIEAKSEHCTVIRPNGDRLDTSVITVEDAIALLDKLEEEK